MLSVLEQLHDQSGTEDASDANVLKQPELDGIPPAAETCMSVGRTHARTTSLSPARQRELTCLLCPVRK